MPPACRAITTALAGYGLNPYDPRPDPREGTNDGRPALNAGGSSSGAGTAANFWAANVGTETSGSILTPANQTMLVGIKPTVGRISRYGIIPITADQDTAGPMARTRGRRGDSARRARRRRARSARSRDEGVCPRVPNSDYTRFLNRARARGRAHRRARAAFVDEARPRQLLREAIALLRKQGATVVDPADIPQQPPPVCRDEEGMQTARTTNCSIVFKYGMKRDFNAWLASLGPSSPVKTLTELREWNLAHRAEGAIKYGQAQLDNLR